MKTLEISNRMFRKIGVSIKTKTEYNNTNLFPLFREFTKENVEKGRSLGIFMTFGGGGGDRKVLLVLLLQEKRGTALRWRLQRGSLLCVQVYTNVRTETSNIYAPRKICRDRLPKLPWLGASLRIAFPNNQKNVHFRECYIQLHGCRPDSCNTSNDVFITCLIILT